MRGNEIEKTFLCMFQTYCYHVNELRELALDCIYLCNSVLMIINAKACEYSRPPPFQNCAKLYRISSRRPSVWHRIFYTTSAVYTNWNIRYGRSSASFMPFHYNVSIFFSVLTQSLSFLPLFLSLIVMRTEHWIVAFFFSNAMLRFQQTYILGDSM